MVPRFQEVSKAVSGEILEYFRNGFYKVLRGFRMLQEHSLK